uniref:Cytosol aminopeptidase n=1 Tax=Glossina brevipalpis TaxID=37001 RepID=A0A1A9W1S2_9MUSC
MLKTAALFRTRQRDIFGMLGLNAVGHAAKLGCYMRNYASQAINQLLQLQHTEICADPPSRGAVFGVYADEEDKTDTGILTPAGWKYNVQRTGGRMIEVLRMSGPMPKVGEARLLFAQETEKIPYYSAVAIVGLGKECLGYNPYEVIDEQKETIRRSVARACMDLARLDTTRIEVDNCGHAESAGEGAGLGVWAYQELRQKKNRIAMPAIDLYTTKDEVCDIEGWRIGVQKAAAQNLTRQLQEMPSNILTPTAFAQNVVEVLCRSGVNVEVKVEGWAESQLMNAFLSVGKASCEAPIFLELSYYGTSAEERPIVLVGQGITYDCGGLCLNPMDKLYVMRADMTGAAVVVATCRAVAALRLPINIRGLIPLCENVMGCNSYRSGDTVKCMNGKHIKIQGTDHEDMLVLADTLSYAQNFCPKCIVDIGTPSWCMHKTLGEAACGVFTNSEILWQQIKHASMHTGDRVWRMPLWEFYTKQVTSGMSADVQNIGKGRGGKPCKAAAFLREFVPCGQWMHIDATNVMFTKGTCFEYLRAGMAGRPTRTVIEFIAQTICKDTAPKMPKKEKKQPWVLPGTFHNFPRKLGVEINLLCTSFALFDKRLKIKRNCSWWFDCIVTEKQTNHQTIMNITTAEHDEKGMKIEIKITNADLPVENIHNQAIESTINANAFWYVEDMVMVIDDFS